MSFVAAVDSHWGKRMTLPIASYELPLSRARSVLNVFVLPLSPGSFRECTAEVDCEVEGPYVTALIWLPCFGSIPFALLSPALDR